MDPLPGPQTPATPTVPSCDIYIRIYDDLKKQIAETVRDARATERNMLLACGAILAYLAGRCPNPVPRFLWYIPTALAVFGGIRTLTLMISITPRGQYLRRLEDKCLRDPPLEGWEAFFRNHRRYRIGVGFSMWVFWIVLIVATIVIPHFLPDPLCMADRAPARGV